MGTQWEASSKWLACLWFPSSPRRDVTCPVTWPEQAPPLLRFWRVQRTHEIPFQGTRSLSL